MADTEAGRLHKPYFARLAVYFREMFPLPVYLPYVVALYLCLDIASQAITGAAVVIDWYGVAGMVSALAMMMLMRTFDDLKDLEIDKELFPDRAIPRGDVRGSDVVSLSITSFIVLIAVNAFAPATWLQFGIMIVYALLTFKWFFAEAIHRRNLFLTMLTHQPVPLFINFYLIHTALCSAGRSLPFQAGHVALLLMFTLPVTAWETGRKTRSADKETDYVTFSRIFGPGNSALISLVCLLLSGSFCLYTGWRLALPVTFFAVTALLMLATAFLYVRFILYPTSKNNVLKNATLGYTTFLFLNMLAHLLICIPISIRL